MFFETTISPLEIFEIRNLFSVETPLLGNINLSITNIGLYMAIASFLVFAISILATNYSRITPNGWSLAQESLYATIHSIVINQINSKNGQVYFPFMCTLFNYIKILSTFISFCYRNYSYIINGHLNNTHWICFLLMGLYLKDINYFEAVIYLAIITYLKYIIIYYKEYILSTALFGNNPALFDLLLTTLTFFYVVQLSVCLDFIFNGIVLPLFLKLISYCRKVLYTLNIQPPRNECKDTVNEHKNSPDPTPNNDNPSIINNSKGKKKRDSSEKQVETVINKLGKSCARISNIGDDHNTTLHFKEESAAFYNANFRFLPAGAKKDLDSLRTKYIDSELDNMRRDAFNYAPSIHKYWLNILTRSKLMQKHYNLTLNIYEDNSRVIKTNNLGGVKSDKSKAFSQQLFTLREEVNTHFNNKHRLILDQIGKSAKIDKILKENSISVKSLVESGILR